MGEAAARAAPMGSPLPRVAWATSKPEQNWDHKVQMGKDSFYRSTMKIPSYQPQALLQLMDMDPAPEAVFVSVLVFGLFVLYF